MTAFTYSDELISDLHKDAYGVRPSASFFYRWWHEMSPAQKQEEWDNIQSYLEREIDREREYAATQTAAFKREIAARMAANPELSKREVVNAYCVEVSDYVARGAASFNNSDLYFERFAYEHVEWELGMSFDTISKFLKED